MNVIQFAGIAALFFLAYYFVGCLVLSLMDDDDGYLLSWAEDFPVGGASTVILLWPFFAIFFLCLRFKK